jgi:hypothetical protein
VLQTIRSESLKHNRTDGRVLTSGIVIVSGLGVRGGCGLVSLLLCEIGMNQVQVARLETGRLSRNS